MGSNVIVTEVDPVRALEAVMDGFTVSHSQDAAQVGDVFISATGGLHAMGPEQLALMKDGALLANSGHFNVEIDIPALEDMAESRAEARPFVQEYTMKDGRRLYLLAEGRLVNLAAAEGHPSSVMDMSFANQALSVEYLATREERLEPNVYPVPKEMDMEVGRLKLQSMGITIDRLSEAQYKYLNSWEEGT
jgi:adenosylhomocysteinase